MRVSGPSCGGARAAGEPWPLAAVGHGQAPLGPPKTRVCELCAWNLPQVITDVLTPGFEGAYSSFQSTLQHPLLSQRLSPSWMRDPKTPAAPLPAAAVPPARPAAKHSCPRTRDLIPPLPALSCIKCATHNGLERSEVRAPIATTSSNAEM